MKIAICDDFEIACLSLKKYLLEYDNMLDIYLFQSGDDILKAELIESFDVVIMDIQLVPDSPIDNNDITTGIDIAYRLKQMDRNIILIYYSGLYSHRMVKTEPFDFLEKPISQKSVNNLMDRIVKWKNHQVQSQFTFTFNCLKTRVDLKEILYFYSSHRLVYIHTKIDDLKFYDKLDNVQKTVEQLGGTFARISKSYYVNMLHIEKSSKTKVQINGEELPISHRYREQYEEILEHYNSL